MKANLSRTYLFSMGLFCLGFGLITMFFPRLLDLFQTADGINAKTQFSDHVWFHGGLDIIAIFVLLFALSREPQSPTILRATAVAALMPTIAIWYSYFATPFWSTLFLLPGLSCLAFVVWGFVLAAKVESAKKLQAAPSFSA